MREHSKVIDSRNLQYPPDPEKAPHMIGWPPPDMINRLSQIALKMEQTAEMHNFPRTFQDTIIERRSEALLQSLKATMSRSPSQRNTGVKLLRTEYKRGSHPFL